MKRIEIHLDDETAAMLIELAGSRNRQSALIRRLVREAAQEHQVARLATLTAEVERLRAQLAAHEDPRNE